MISHIALVLQNNNEDCPNVINYYWAEKIINSEVTSIFLRKFVGTVLPLTFAICWTITSASSILFLLRSHRGDSGMIQ